MPGKHNYAPEERELSESKQKRKDNRKENRESRAADRQANRDSRKKERQANRKKRLTAKAKVVRARAEANIDKIGARREAGQTARMETRQSRVKSQVDRYRRIQKRIDKNTPEKKQEPVPANYGPFKMVPGAHSRPSMMENVNFRDDQIKKFGAFPNMYPENFNAARVAAAKKGEKTFEVGGESFPVTSKAGAEMHHAGMYNAQLHVPGHSKPKVVKDTIKSKPVRIIENRKKTAELLNSPNPPKPTKPNKFYK